MHRPSTFCTPRVCLITHVFFWEICNFSCHILGVENDDNVQDVRKMVILSIPAINMTIPQIVERTADVSDLVRKAVYLVLCNKFPIPMLR